MKLTVIGAGSFGTAMTKHASTVSGGKNEVMLYCEGEDQANAINAERHNPLSMREIELGPNVVAIGGEKNLPRVLARAEHVILALPSQVLGGVLETVARHTGGGAGLRLLSLAKGIEIGSGRFMHQIADEVVPNAVYSALSGPSHAEEVATGMPSAVVVASRDESAAVAWQSALSDDRLRVYTSGDVLGVELGGSMKNVIAIAVGIARAMGFGDNTAAALVTRGLAEIMRYGASLGANPLTLAGLAGIGDLMVTCYSVLSRNFRFGTAIGQGRTPDEAAREIGQVVEGMYTVRALVARAREANLDLPVSEGVYRILYENVPVREVMSALLTREPKPEMRGA
jgi:glycerol-3-phosphate dehydrogenase (NAD(P)+)